MEMRCFISDAVHSQLRWRSVVISTFNRRLLAGVLAADKLAIPQVVCQTLSMTITNYGGPCSSN